MIEVKGPGDRLSTKQILWLDYLHRHGAPVEVCYVEGQQHPVQSVTVSGRQAAVAFNLWLLANKPLPAILPKHSPFAALAQVWDQKGCCRKKGRRRPCNVSPQHRQPREAPLTEAHAEKRQRQQLWPAVIALVVMSIGMQSLPCSSHSQTDQAHLGAKMPTSSALLSRCQSDGKGGS